MLIWALATAAAGMVLVDRAAVFTMRPQARGPNTRAAELGLDAEEIEFDSSGVTLRGELIRPAEENRDRPLTILIHGWTGTAALMLHVARPLVEAGYPVLVFDVRNHGRSERAPAVTIRHFRDDLTRAVELAARVEPDRPRVVLGHSLGGGAAILAAARGAPIDGLVLVSAPADLFEVTAGFYSDHNLPGTLLTRIFLPSWRLRAGESFRHLNPESAAAELSVPVAVVQGASDSRVPPQHAERIARQAGCEVQLLPKVGHRDILQRRELYEAAIRLLERVREEREAA
jgi:pimeloyl-ACP methyl ester carboxylesterase